MIKSACLHCHAEMQRGGPRSNAGLCNLHDVMWPRPIGIIYAYEGQDRLSQAGSPGRDHAAVPHPPVSEDLSCDEEDWR